MHEQDCGSESCGAAQCDQIGVRLHDCQTTTALGGRVELWDSRTIESSAMVDYENRNAMVQEANAYMNLVLRLCVLNGVRQRFSDGQHEIVQPWRGRNFEGVEQRMNSVTRAACVSRFRNDA